MILGIGTDLVTNTRVKKLYQKYGDRFLNKILSVNEKIEFFNSLAFKSLRNDFFIKAINLTLNTFFY